MASENGHQRELRVLLEKWCEDRLSAADIARLERLVLSDPEAMRRYILYVHLHGTLHWDAAVIEKAPTKRSASQMIPFSDGATAPHALSRRVVGSRPSSRPKRGIRLIVWASLLVAAAMLVWVVAPFAPEPAPALQPTPAPDVAVDQDATPAADEQSDPDDVAPALAINLTDRPSDGPLNEPLTPLPDNELAPQSPIPSTDQEIDVVTFIDRQLSAGWVAAGVSPSPVADDGEWLRRVCLDLTGRIPSVDVLDAFLSEDEPEKRHNLVERVLSSDAFARHMTTLWTIQLVGRASQKARERHGLQRFLVRQFRENRPWDETVAELIAAEGSVEENGAAGYLLAHLNNEAIPATAITSRLFLGQQVQCTQCHKHPWNDWSQEQFWNLNAFFQQVRIRRRSVADPPPGQPRSEPVLVTEPVGGPTYFENLRGVMQATYPVFAGRRVDPGPTTDRRRALAALLSEGDDTQLARAFVNRMWAHFFGYGFTNPVDDMGPHQTPSHPELLERLSREFVTTGYDVRELIRWITASRAYQLSSRMIEGNEIDDPAAGNPPLFSRMTVKFLTPEQVYDSLLVAARGGTNAGSTTFPRQDREEWVQQFFDVLENEENSEVSTFGGSITQALTLMNGPLIETALSGEPDTALARILSARTNDVQKIRQLCRAALAREPTPRELSRFRRIVNQAKSVRGISPTAAVNETLRDIYWAYLNSSEFVSNR